MNIEGKTLDLDVCVSIEGATKIVKAVGIGFGMQLTHKGAYRLLIMKKGLRLKSKPLDRGYLQTGPVSAIGTYSVTLLPSRVAVRRVNGISMEDILGIDLQKWSLEELWMRLNMEIHQTAERNLGRPGVEKLRISAKDASGFIGQLRIAQNMPETKTDRSKGVKMLLDVCDFM